MAHPQSVGRGSAALWPPAPADVRQHAEDHSCEGDSEQEPERVQGPEGWPLAASGATFVLYAISSAKRMCVSVSSMFLPKRV
jgi:hypothetical protein